MRIMLLGGPGAGKGTQAALLIQHFQIPTISTGDMLRAAVASKSALGLQVQAIMDKGQLVSDDIIIALVKERLSQPDCQRGFLLDGFPRTIIQAEALKQANIPLDHVVEIEVDDEEIVKRISGRRTHPASGRVYHVLYNPPKVANQDDGTGEPLVQRDDDREEIIRKRLQIYHEQTEPLVDYYKNQSETQVNDAPSFHQVKGVGSVEEIFSTILKAIS